MSRVADDLVRRRIELRGGEISLYQPSESRDLPDEGEIKWAPLVPYWSVLWRSGVALAREVEGMALSGRRIVEVGCGLAVPGIAAARAGGVVLATDCSDEALDLVGRNAGKNGVQVEVANVDWGAPRKLMERGPFDLVLAADVLYEDAAHEPLLALLPQLAPEAWLADPGRDAALPFLEEARRRWEVETLVRGVVRLHHVRFGQATT